MSQLEKLIHKIFSQQKVSYNDAERILFELGYALKISDSHHVFRKAGHKHLTLKRRPKLLAYQITDLQEVLKNHGIKKSI